MTSVGARGKKSVRKFGRSKFFNWLRSLASRIRIFFGSTWHCLVDRCNFKGGSEILWCFNLKNSIGCRISFGCVSERSTKTMSSEKFRVFVLVLKPESRTGITRWVYYRTAMRGGPIWSDCVSKRCSMLRAARASGGVLDYSSPNGRWPLHVIYSGLLAYIMVY